MPTYEYVCKNCGERLEVVQSFSDEALSECPNCGGTLKKVFGNVGIVFRGSGFYKTDSRGTSAATSLSNGESKSDAGTSSSPEPKSTETKGSDSAPAAAAAPTTATSAPAGN